MVEWFGTAMSVIIAISLTQKNIKMLRWINLFGASGFCIYGVLIQAWPVVGLNGFITLVDIYYLIEFAVRKDLFSYINGSVETSPYCRSFLEFYKEDIQRFHVGQKWDKKWEYCLILRNMVPVSVILFERISEDSAEIKLDYATPQYRDFKNARFFLERVLPEPNELNFRKLRTKTHNGQHRRYLLKIGYREEGDSFVWERE